MSEKLRVAVMASMHPVDDGRVAYRAAASFRDMGYAVAWIGPDRRQAGAGPEGIEYLTFPPSPGFAGRVRAFLCLLRTGFKRPSDVLYAVEPDSASAAVLLRILGRARTVVFDVHENYHEYQLRVWVRGHLRRFATPLVLGVMRILTKLSDIVIGVNQTVLRPLRSRPDRTYIVRNTPTVSWANRSMAVESMPGAFRIMHGKATLQHGTPVVLQSLARLLDRGIDAEVVLFEYFGRTGSWFGDGSFDDYLQKLGVAEHVDVVPLMSYEEVPELLATCHAGIIAYDRRFAPIALPNRLFEYMAAGLPLVVPEFGTEMAPVVSRAGCGLLVDTEVVAEVEAALATLAHDRKQGREMGLAARRSYEMHYSWEAQFLPVLRAIEHCMRLRE